MELIISSIAQGIFITGFLFALYFVFKKMAEAKANARPGIEQPPELLNTFKGIVNKIPGLSEKDKLLNADTGTFYTTAEIANVWERVVDSISRQTIFVDDKNNWKKIQPDQPYRRIMLSATWLDHENLAEVKNKAEIPNAKVDCTLKFEELKGGGTSIEFQYDIHSSATYSTAQKLKRLTNERINDICLELTQNPNSGLPF